MKPSITRSETGRRYRTARQRQAAARDFLMHVAHANGCSIRLIAEAFGVHYARAWQILRDYSPAANNRKCLPDEPADQVTESENSPEGAGRLS